MAAPRKVLIPWLIVTALSAVLVWREVPRLLRGHFIERLVASKDGTEELAALDRLSVLFPVDSISPVSPLRSIAEIEKDPSPASEPILIELRWRDGYSHFYQLKEKKNLSRFIRE